MNLFYIYHVPSGKFLRWNYTSFAGTWTTHKEATAFNSSWQAFGGAQSFCHINELPHIRVVELLPVPTKGLLAWLVRKLIRKALR